MSIGSAGNGGGGGSASARIRHGGSATSGAIHLIMRPLPSSNAVGCPHEMSWRVKDDHRRRDSRPSSTRETRAKTDENGVFVWNRHTKKFT